MADTFELWEMSTGNLMGAYESEARALAVMTRVVRSYGPSYADTVALIVSVQIPVRRHPRELA
jgi:hypothetical protein